MPAVLLRRWGNQIRGHNWLVVWVDFAIVVAGVFLGLEAANWNEARHERAQERRYYRQIIEDLRADQATLRTARARSMEFDAAAEQTLAALQSGLPKGMSPGRFAVQVHYSGFLYLPRPARRTYDELISTGNLRMLRSNRAKAAIAAYYDGYEDSRQWDDLLRAQQSRYWDLTAGALPRSVLKAAIRFREPPLSPAQAADILAKLRARHGIADLLIGMAAHQERVRRDSEDLAERGRELVATLEPLSS